MTFGDRKLTDFHTKAKKPLKRSSFKKATRVHKTVKKRSTGLLGANKRKNLTKAVRVKRLKKKLWVLFSQYIRKREADHNGYLTTVDGVVSHWQACDCGHLWHNSDRNALLGGNELWYYENNFAPQSNQGNRLNADDSAQKYMLWATEKYGADEVRKMRRMKETYKLWTEEELVEKYNHYKEKFDLL